MTTPMSEEDTDILILDNFIISYVVDSNRNIMRCNSLLLIVLFR